jgi:hypothetical protein
LNFTHSCSSPRCGWGWGFLGSQSYVVNMSSVVYTRSLAEAIQAVICFHVRFHVGETN